MFTYTEKSLSTHTFQFRIKEDGRIINFADTIRLWQDSEEFRVFYTNLLIEVPFSGYFWENKPVTIKSMVQDYEFIIRGSNVFDTKIADKNAFASYFKEDLDIVSFYNLGGDAKLVVPCFRGNNPEHYTHFASFIRNVQDKQLHRFWQKLGVEYENAINEKPLWLSTSGLGIYWLHVRIDSIPKYYTYTPYRKHL